MVTFNQFQFLLPIEYQFTSSKPVPLYRGWSLLNEVLLVLQKVDNKIRLRSCLDLVPGLYRCFLFSAPPGDGSVRRR